MKRLFGTLFNFLRKYRGIVPKAHSKRRGLEGSPLLFYPANIFFLNFVSKNELLWIWPTLFLGGGVKKWKRFSWFAYFLFYFILLLLFFFCLSRNLGSVPPPMFRNYATCLTLHKKLIQCKVWYKPNSIASYSFWHTYSSTNPE